MTTTRSFALHALAVLALATTLVPGASAVAPPLPAAYPAAGELVATRVAVRVSPDRTAKVIRLLQQFRSDYRLQIVLALGQASGPDGTAWFKLNLPMRPNGTVGWIPAASATLRPTQSRIVVHRGLRRIEVFRDGRRLLRAKVAVGAPGRETPLGEFYVTARLVPDDPFLGAFALETSAYSRLTEWPGGGKVGIHGTSKPWLLGQAVSHGCVRVSNQTALALKRLAASCRFAFHRTRPAARNASVCSACSRRQSPVRGRIGSPRHGSHRGAAAGQRPDVKFRRAG